MPVGGGGGGGDAGGGGGRASLLFLCLWWSWCTLQSHICSRAGWELPCCLLSSCNVFLESLCLSFSSSRLFVCPILPLVSLIVPFFVSLLVPLFVPLPRFVSSHSSSLCSSCPFLRPFLRPSVRPFVRPSVRPFVRPSVRPFVRPLARPFVRPLARPFVFLFVLPFARPFVRPSVRPFVRPSVCLFSRPFARRSVRPSVRRFVCRLLSVEKDCTAGTGSFAEQSWRQIRETKVLKRRLFKRQTPSKGFRKTQVIASMETHSGSCGILGVLASPGDWTVRSGLHVQQTGRHNAGTSLGLVAAR